MHWVVFAVIGYFAGSIPFGLLLTRMAGMGDVRNVGSGNIGATNVLRTGNRKIAALTLLCDGLKGYLPVVAASFWATPEAMIAAGLGALAGHVFPIWLKFKGGKGVATGLGVIFGWSWPLGLLFAAAWLAFFYATRISSVGALAGVVAPVGGALWMQGTFPTWPYFVVAAVVWLMHRANIARLIKGDEPKSSLSRKA